MAMGESTRQVIRIDEELCDGCGECVPACEEGAIQIIDGKARLVSETYCDGLGACLSECPQGAITVEEREAAPFDPRAVEEHLARLRRGTGGTAAHTPPSPAASPHPAPGGFQVPVAGGCPGSAMRSFAPPPPQAAGPSAGQAAEGSATPSQLRHWPVQLMLVQPGAPFLQGADLLISADCVPFAVPDFHARYLAGRALLVGCPKLDDLDFYFEKLAAVISTARPRSITVVKMEVPCCMGIAQAAIEARARVAPDIPVRVHTVSLRGEELACEEPDAAPRSMLV